MSDETQAAAPATGGGEVRQPQTETPRSEVPGTPDPPEVNATPASGGEAPASELADREPPAEEQAPVATAADKAIVGDSGLFNQQPGAAVSSQDTPVRSSAPPAQAQSGVPIPGAVEDGES